METKKIYQQSNRAMDKHIESIMKPGKFVKPKAIQQRRGSKEIVNDYSNNNLESPKMDMHWSGPRDQNRFRSSNGTEKLNGRSSMNDVSRNIFSPGNGDKSPSTHSKSGMFAYAQPLGGIQHLPGQKQSVSQSFQIMEQEPPMLSALSNNIMKLNQEKLSYGQVKCVRGQIQRDCSLLRNRVRLLQTEMMRSQKKIVETSRKAGQLRKVKE